MQEGAEVLVIGSANLDYIVQVAAPPAPGETVLAKNMIKHPGGKGANQAVAAAKMGAEVRFVGCVGDDNDGALLLRELRAEGVDTTAVEIVSHARTGLALVSVFDSGENSITVVPGANFSLHPGRVKRAIAGGGANGTGAVVLQGEVKSEIIDAAAQAAEAVGARVVLNLAPYRAVAKETLSLCDPLVVNQSEAEAMVGFQIPEAAAAQQALTILLATVRSAVITLGGAGACWADTSGSGHVPAPEVEAVMDTTGAGDAFVGALAAELSAGLSLRQATETGVRAGSFAVGRFGAQSSYPTRSELGILASTETGQRVR
ncbi:ribokinase [Pseudarthrobacter siccitolerans]|uniref:Ribokinase n=1 Tax=Pseudarthrobacter siccitolerans TaxID=861266 RepID=A0ABU0PMH4_9MICC|nr:ribokinase [Pseudarthrobacter siccitolerans]MDQ0675159.1 ribokinase [Pseudarthrobacter siccitolerans]